MSEMNCNVEYRDVQEFPGYRVGNDGSVWSGLKRTRTKGRGYKTLITRNWKLLKPQTIKNGYMQVMLYKNKKPCPVRVHTLVLKYFIGFKIRGYECRHLDDDKSNNQLANLCWGTKLENIADKIRNGNSTRGSKSWSAKLNEKKVLAARLLRKMGVSTNYLAAQYGVSLATISQAINKTRWKHLT